MKYQVIKQQYFNDYGIGERSYFYVKYEKTNWFGYTRMVYVKHVECDMGDCYKSKTTFKSESAAIEFIREILVKNKPLETYVTTIIEEINK